MNAEENLRVYTRRELQRELKNEERWKKPSEEANLMVYMRRQQTRATGEAHVQWDPQDLTTIEVVDLPDGETSATPTSWYDGSAYCLEGTRVGAGKPPNRYGFEPDIANYVS